jgi:DUF4097 and DUF4098 domain-containing protein YvlB
MKSWVSVLAAGLLSTSALADHTEELSWTFELNEGGRISLENVNGDVDITGVAGNQVEIVAFKRAGDEDYLRQIEILIEDSPDAIRVETKHPDSGIKGMFNWGRDSSGSVRFTLKVPESVQLDAIESVNGNVTIKGVKGLVKAGTVNGDVMATGLMSDAGLETVNGSVEAYFDRFGGQQKANCESVNGRLLVVLPEDADATVSAETINGGIDGSDFGLKVDKGFIGRDMQGAIASGSARLSLDTVNGSIKIRKD